MPNNLDQIVDCLRQLQHAPLVPRSAAFGDEDCSPCYLYLTSGAQSTSYAEVLAEIPETARSSRQAANLERLRELGWYPPLPGDAYWHRFWRALSEADQLAMARQIQQALETAYGIGTDQPLSVHYSASCDSHSQSTNPREGGVQARHQPREVCGCC